MERPWKFSDFINGNRFILVCNCLYFRYNSESSFKCTVSLSRDWMIYENYFSPIGASRTWRSVTLSTRISHY